MSISLAAQVAIDAWRIECGGWARLAHWIVHCGDLVCTSIPGVVPDHSWRSGPLVGMPGGKFIGKLFNDSFRQGIGHLEDMVIDGVEGPGVFVPIQFALRLEF